MHEFTYGDLARVREEFARTIEGAKKSCAAGSGENPAIGQICRVLEMTNISVDDLPKLPEGYNPNMPLPANWFEADKLCRAQGKRLPTEMEWEYDAIGNSGAKYAVAEWRRELDSGLVVFNTDGPAQACSKPKTPLGLCDMTGNMWEWVSDWYREDEYSRMGSHDPNGPDEGKVRVLRGGAWDNTYDELLRAADRHDRDPRDSSVNVGFRCVSSPG